ncbi:MAG: glycoside hydrolase family 38 C-terminal domain-containing protein [Prolixibacteraceae bacterium]
MSKNCWLFISLILALFTASASHAQTAWFADGYHGGIYGHYPMWQARFMVDKLTGNPGWKINLEIEPETWDTVCVKDAENFKAFQDYYEKEGRFGRIEFVNPTYAQPYCYNVSGESIIRQFAYGIAKTRAYFPSATFLTYAVEEPCFTSSLPAILKGFGYKYAVLRNPNTCWGGYTSAFGRDLVNWIGPDGTSLPAVPRYACERLSSSSTWQTESWTNSNEFIAACFAAGVKYPVGMTFQDAGWDGGPWRNAYEPTVYTTWTSYIDMIRDKVEPVDWKFSQEDIRPGLVWGAQVLQKIAQQVRASENRLIVAEKMASLDYLLNGKAWPAADFAEAWRNLMLAQHHDCWIVPYNGKPGDTWADKVGRWTTTANRIAREKIDGTFSTENVAESGSIRVFNTSGAGRTSLVAIAVPDTNTDPAVFTMKGKALPVQLVTGPDGKRMLTFEATVPGMGYATFMLKKAKKPGSKPGAHELSGGTLKIETPYYSAVIDPAKGGTITSLIDKKHSKRQLVEPGRVLNDLRGYFYRKEKFLNGSDHPATVTLVEDGALFIRARVDGHIDGIPYSQLITFGKSDPLIGFELTIQWNGQPAIGAYDQSLNYKAEDREKAFYDDSYKLHLQFPLKAIGERLFKNAPFDVCESGLKDTRYSSWDSLRHNVILNWVDVANAANDYGIALFSDHTTSYLHTGGLPLGLTVQYAGKGLWGRHYGTDGPTHLRYALLPHAGNWEQAEVENVCNDWNEPLIARYVTPGDEPSERSLLQVNDKNLHVSAVFMEGEDLLVRLYNTSSAARQPDIRWNCSAESTNQVDLNGKVTKAGGSRSIPQFGFQTLRLIKPKLK